MSIRLRLTLIYSTILALTLIVFSALLYNIQARYTLSILEGDLSRAARSVVQAWSRLRFVPHRDGPFTNPDGQQGAYRTPFVPGLKDFRTRDAVRLLGPDGSILDLSINEQDSDLELLISAEGLEQLAQGKTWTQVSPGEESHPSIDGEPLECAVDHEIGSFGQARCLPADPQRPAAHAAAVV